MLGVEWDKERYKSDTLLKNMLAEEEKDIFEYVCLKTPNKSNGKLKTKKAEKSLDNQIEKDKTILQSTTINDTILPCQTNKDYYLSCQDDKDCYYQSSCQTNKDDLVGNFKRQLLVERRGSNDTNQYFFGMENSRPRPLNVMTVGLKTAWDSFRPSNFQKVDKCFDCQDTGIFIQNLDFNLCTSCSETATTTTTLIAGRYQIIKQIGTGTFSKVFLAKDSFLAEMTDSVQVIKILHNGLDELARNEDAILRKIHQKYLCSPVMHGVPRFYGLIKYRGFYGLVMERLYELQLEKISGSLNLLRKLILDTVMVLHHLHYREATIHADLKLDNIMYSQREEAFKLIDYGNCVPIDKIDSYYEGFEIQSLLYRAPEVLIGLEFDCKIDIWSLGIIIAQVLAKGRFPWYADSPTGLLQQITEILGPLPNIYSKGKFINTFMNNLISSNSTKTSSSPSIPSLTMPFENTFNQTNTSFWKRWRRSNLARLLEIKDTALIDLLGGMLVADPTKRLDTLQILRHEFLSPLVLFPPNC